MTNTIVSQDYMRGLETDVLARTVWGEARGEGAAGMQAVACVVLNRLAVAQGRGRCWWGNDVIGICQKPYQFSCWTKTDANFKKLLAVDKNDAAYTTALRIAARAVSGYLPDITHGATHYHAKSIMPDWAKAEEPCAVIGGYLFYRDV